MDPATLAAAALTILVPFAKDAGKELVKTVGEVGVGKAKELAAWLKQCFAGDPVAAKDLSRFEAEPDKFEAGLESTIKEKAGEDPAFAAELKRRLDEIGPMIVVFQDIKKGKNIKGVDADEIRSGRVAVTQRADDVEGMTGVVVKKLGG
jgi:hypothetical protein